MRNDRGGSSSSSKGKKSNSEKPRPPRRGLGVDQLEKILHGQMGSSYPADFNHEDMKAQKAYSCFSYSSTSLASYCFHPTMMMRHCEYYQSIIYADSLPTTTTSWNTRNGILDCQYSAQPIKTRQLLNLLDSQPTKRKQRNNSMEPSSQNSESGDARELDLELRLSL